MSTGTATETAPPEVPIGSDKDPHFLERVGSLPIVTSTIDQLAYIYQYTKGTNPYVKYTLETAEAGVKTVAQSALPVVNKFERPIGAIDAIACSQLDKLEQKFPIVTKPTDEVVGESKKVYESTLKPHVDAVTGVTQSAAEKVGAAKQYTVDTVTSVKDYGVNKVNDAKNYTYEKVATTATYGKGKLDQALETPGGQVVLSGVDRVLDKTEQYVDYYLPEEKKEGVEEPMDADKGKEAVVCPLKPTDLAYGKLVNVSDKVRRRMYAKTLRELQHVKKRSQETLERLNFTVDLIEYAKNNIDGAKSKASSAKDKFLQVWEEINKEEEEGIEMSNLAADGEAEAQGAGTEKDQVSQATLEKRAIATARHLTSQLKRGFGTMMNSVYVLPVALQKKVGDAKTFSESLYTNFANAQTLQDIPSTLVSQTRTQVVYLQETVNTYTEYLRNNYFGSWLGSQKIEDLEGEGENGEDEDKKEEEKKDVKPSSSRTAVVPDEARKDSNDK